MPPEFGLPFPEQAKVVPQPRKARQHLGVVAAEAHHLAEALVERADRAVAERAVLDHEERHAPRGDAGHRPDRAEVVVGREFDAAARGELLGRGEVARPALEHDRAADRAFQRAAHPRPLDRRTAWSSRRPAVELRNELAGAAYVREHRLGGEDLLHRDPVRFVNARTQSCKCSEQARVAARGRGPVHLNHAAPFAARSRREPGEADVDDANRAVQQARDGIGHGARKRRV
jgi:hypothetical protein